MTSKNEGRDSSQSFIGKKITLLDSNIQDFKKLTTKPKGRIINVTTDQQLVVRWFTQNHPNYTIDIMSDRIFIHEQKINIIPPKNHCHRVNDHKSHRSRIRA